MTQPETPRVQPARGLSDLTAYRVPRPNKPIDLYLDGNEGVAPPAALLDIAHELGPEVLRRYPSKGELEAQLAAEFGVDAAQVLVTAGGDDALDRACRAVLEPGRELVLPVPTFEMLERYPRLVGATTVPVPWDVPAFPIAGVLDALRDATGAIAIVSPNNPTGAVATTADLEALSAAAPHVLLLVDLAYVEFADVDLTAAALRLPNAVVVRTFSKAWGLAGLRVGYAIGPPRIIDWLRAVGGPYPTSGLSLAIASRRLSTGAADMRAFIERVRVERAALSSLLIECGAAPVPSQANFVLGRFGDARLVQAALADMGIAVRAFPDRPTLHDALRITCPGRADAFERLCDALRTTAAQTPAAFDKTALEETRQ